MITQLSGCCLHPWRRFSVINQSGASLKFEATPTALSVLALSSQLDEVKELAATEKGAKLSMRHAPGEYAYSWPTCSRVFCP